MTQEEPAAPRDCEYHVPAIGTVLGDASYVGRIVPEVELLGAGRLAEVFAVGPDAVVKLDRPEFNGVADHEAAIMRELARGGLPVPRVFDTVVIEGRHGILMERLDGPLLSDLIRTGSSLDNLAERFVDLHVSLHTEPPAALPGLVERLVTEIEGSGLPAETRAELVGCARSHGDGWVVCHFDFHPDNVIVTRSGWRVIDWQAAASGPPVADFARTLMLRADAPDDFTSEFMRHVRRRGIRRRGLDRDEVVMWIRIVAAARLSEGFTGDEASRLKALAERRAAGAGSTGTCGRRRPGSWRRAR